MSVNKGKIVFWSVAGLLGLVGIGVGVNFYRSKKAMEAARLQGEQDAKAEAEKNKGGGVKQAPQPFDSKPNVAIPETPGRPNTSVKAVYANSSMTSLYKINSNGTQGSRITYTASKDKKIGYLLPTTGLTSVTASAYYPVSLNYGGNVTHALVSKSSSTIK